MTSEPVPAPSGCLPLAPPPLRGWPALAHRSPLPPLGQAAPRCSDHRPKKQKVQTRMSRFEEENDFHQLSHIFGKKEPRIAFVSQWRKASVPPAIRKPCRGESIQAELHSCKLGAGSPQRAWLEATPKGSEGMEGRGLDSTFQPFFAPLHTSRALHKAQNSDALPGTSTDGSECGLNAGPCPPPASPRLHFISQCTPSGPLPGDLFLMSEIKGLAMSGSLPHLHSLVTIS